MLKPPDKQIQVNVTGPFTVPFFLCRQAALGPVRFTKNNDLERVLDGLLV
jgi:hypothetical protein